MYDHDLIVLKWMQDSVKALTFRKHFSGQFSDFDQLTVIFFFRVEDSI